MQEAVADTFSREGFTVHTAHPLGITSNWELSEVTQETLDGQVAEVAALEVQAVTTFCTNLMAAALVPRWERTYQVPAIDTVSAAVWGALRLAGVQTSRISALSPWGTLFDLTSDLSWPL